MPKLIAHRRRAFVLVSGFIAVLLGSGLANADIRGAFADVFGLTDDSPSIDADNDVDEVDQEVGAIGGLEGMHLGGVEDTAKLEDDPAEGDEEAEEAGGGSDPGLAGSDDTDAAVEADTDLDEDDVDDEAQEDLDTGETEADDDTDADEVNDEETDAEEGTDADDDESE